MAPAPDVVTARLVLRPLTYDQARVIVDGGHGDDWAEGYPTDGDRQIAALLVAAGPPAGPGETRSTAGDALGHRRIIDRATRLVIGGIGFASAPDTAGVVRIGYGVAPRWRNRGLATEAVRAMIELTSTDPRVRRVHADTEITNVASRRVLEKAGMSLLRADGVQVVYGIECSGAVR